jgi:hypothetical protein
MNVNTIKEILSKKDRQFTNGELEEIEKLMNVNLSLFKSETIIY